MSRVRRWRWNLTHRHLPVCDLCGWRHRQGTPKPFACLKALGGTFRGVTREN